MKNSLHAVTLRFLLAALPGLATGLLAADRALPGFLAERLTNRPPNIVLIMADDLGYGDLGCYGQTRIQTPHLDQLAREGMRFTQAYAGSSLGPASRASLFTGLHTGHTLTRDEVERPLRAEDLSLGKVLQQAGYQTGAIGQWGLGRENSTGTPHQQGFEEWLGFLTLAQGEEYYPAYLWRSSVLNKVYDNALLLDANLDGKEQVYIPDYFTMAATNYIRISRYKPFFLYLNYNLVRANTSLAEKSGNGMVVPSDAPYARESWPAPEKYKAAMITRLDRYVGQLLQHLAVHRLTTNTMVIFTSDNGPHAEGGVNPVFFDSAGPFRGGKGSLLEGGLRVPLIVSWPGHVPAGVVQENPVAFWDFLPTFAEAARTAPPPAVDGISFLPTLLGQEQTNRHDHLYWEITGPPLRQAIRLGNWKGIRNAPDQPWQLYNLRADPAEEKNVAQDNADVVTQLEAMAEKLHGQGASPP